MINKYKPLRILGLLSFLLILILVLFFSFKFLNTKPLNTKSRTSTDAAPLSSTQTNQIVFEDGSPEGTVYNFYREYLDCLNNHFNKPDGRSPEASCSFSDSKYLDAKLSSNLNSINLLCAQELPIDFTVDKAKITDNLASTTVRTHYSESGENPISVKLQNSDEKWKITDVVCSY